MRFANIAPVLPPRNVHVEMGSRAMGALAILQEELLWRCADAATLSVADLANLASDYDQKLDLLEAELALRTLGLVRPDLVRRSSVAGLWVVCAAKFGEEV